MNPPMNIDPEVLRRIIEQYQQTQQVPTGIAPQGYPTYSTMEFPQQTNVMSQPQPNSNQIGFPQPQNLEDLNELYRAGKIDKNQYDQLFEQTPEFNYRNSDEKGVLADFEQYGKDNPSQTNYAQLFGSMGVGVGLNSALFNIGRYAGMDSGTTGRNAGLAGSIGKTLVGGARTFASGLGFSKKNEFVQDYYQDKQKEINYTPSPQYANNNYMGGFEDGGSVNMSEPQNGGKGMKNEFNGFKVGDSIEFEYGGKIEKGVIGKIENGQIFLK